MKKVQFERIAGAFLILLASAVFSRQPVRAQTVATAPQITAPKQIAPGQARKALRRLAAALRSGQTGSVPQPQSDEQGISLYQDPQTAAKTELQYQPASTADPWRGGTTHFIWQDTVHVKAATVDQIIVNAATLNLGAAIAQLEKGMGFRAKVTLPQPFTAPQIIAAMTAGNLYGSTANVNQQANPLNVKDGEKAGAGFVADPVDPQALWVQLSVNSTNADVKNAFLAEMCTWISGLDSNFLSQVLSDPNSQVAMPLSLDASIDIKQLSAHADLSPHWFDGDQTPQHQLLAGKLPPAADKQLHFGVDFYDSVALDTDAAGNVVIPAQSSSTSQGAMATWNSYLSPWDTQTTQNTAADPLNPPEVTGVTTALPSAAPDEFDDRDIQYSAGLNLLRFVRSVNFFTHQANHITTGLTVTKPLLNGTQLTPSPQTVTFQGTITDDATKTATAASPVTAQLQQAVLGNYTGTMTVQNRSDAAQGAAATQLTAQAGDQLVVTGTFKNKNQLGLDNPTVTLTLPNTLTAASAVTVTIGAGPAVTYTSTEMTVNGAAMTLHLKKALSAAGKTALTGTDTVVVRYTATAQAAAEAAADVIPAMTLSGTSATDTTPMQVGQTNTVRLTVTAPVQMLAIEKVPDPISFGTNQPIPTSDQLLQRTTPNFQVGLYDNYPTAQQWGLQLAATPFTDGQTNLQGHFQFTTATGVIALSTTPATIYQNTAAHHGPFSLDYSGSQGLAYKVAANQHFAVGQTYTATLRWTMVAGPQQ